MSNKFKVAFTLIELLVVIAIIGILSGLIIVGMSSTTQSANIAKAQIFSTSLRDSLLISLVSEWKFDELSTATEGAVISDSWSGNNNGTLSTSSDGLDKLLTSSNCVFGKCLKFDGSNDYINITNNDNVKIHGSIAIGAWIKGNTSNTLIIGKGAYLGSYVDVAYQLGIYSANKPVFYACTGSSLKFLVTTQNAIDTNWHYIVGSSDGATAKIYLDGKLDNTYAITILTDINDGLGSLHISEATTRAFNGNIDDVRLYNNSVPVSQIREDYYAGVRNLLMMGLITKNDYQQRLSGLN